MAWSDSRVKQSRADGDQNKRPPVSETEIWKEILPEEEKAEYKEYEAPDDAPAPLSFFGFRGLRWLRGHACLLRIGWHGHSGFPWLFRNDDPGNDVCDQSSSPREESNYEQDSRKNGVNIQVFPDASRHSADHSVCSGTIETFHSQSPFTAQLRGVQRKCCRVTWFVTIRKRLRLLQGRDRAPSGCAIRHLPGQVNRRH